MPLVDLPLSELHKYSGRNPCPADMDAYWDASFKELDAASPDIELRPSRFQALGVECFDLFFTGVGGARVHAKYLRPRKSSGQRPAVLQFHGYAGNSGDWHDKLVYAAGLGFAVAALDCRGQGGGIWFSNSTGRR